MPFANATERSEARRPYEDLVGKKIRIVSMNGEPKESGKTGIVRRVFVDPWGDVGLRGTWGGLTIYPGQDVITVCDNPGAGCTHS